MASVGGSVHLDSVLSSLGMSRQFAEQVGGSLRSGKADAAAMAQLIHSMHVSMDMQKATAGGGGSGIPDAGFVPKGRDYLAQAYGEQAAPPIGTGFGGFNRPGALGFSRLGRSLQAAMLASPEAAQGIEKALAGRLLPDGRNDGRFTAYRSTVNRTGQFIKQALLNNDVPRSRIPVALSSVNVMMTNPAVANGPQGSILKGLMAMEANVVSTVKGWDKSGGASDPETAAIAKAMGINPAKMSYEDVVALSLMKYAKNKEGDIMEKIQGLDKSMAAADHKQGAGFFGGLTDASAGGTTAKALFGQTAATTATDATASSILSGAGQGLPSDPNQMSDTMKQQMLQKLMSDLQKTYEMLTNIMKSMHDMQMSPIRNLRG